MILAERNELRRVGGVVGGAVEAAEGTKVQVVIIRPGLSENGLEYRPDVLRSSVRLWEGASAFLDHPTAIDMSRAGGRSVRDLAGYYSNARYKDGVGVTATLTLLDGTQAGDSAADLVKQVLETKVDDEAGPNVGISADMVVRKRPLGQMTNGKTMWEVQEIMKVNSADIVVNPSAGGYFDRALEAEEVDSIADGGAAARQATPLPRSIGNRESGTAIDPATTAGAVTTGSDSAVMDGLRDALAGELLTARLANSNLPEPAQAMIRRQFESRAFQPAELDRSIDDLRKLLATSFEHQVVSGNGALRPLSGYAGTRVGMGAKERVFLAVERLFGLDVPDSRRDIPKFEGIRDAYITITGDSAFRGTYDWENSVLGSDRGSVIREANEVKTTVLNDALTNALNKALVRDYRGQPKWWDPIVNKASTRDVKQQTRVLLNDFSSLSTVAEFGAYTNLAWGDTQEAYTPTKKGNTVAVTLEAIINDDLRAVTRIPSKLAVAAAITINESISNLFTQSSGAGPTLDSDNHRVFDATNHGNRGNTALSSTSVQAGSIAMMKQANSAGKRLGIRPAFLLVPPDLAYSAQVLLQTASVPGSANNDVNVLRGTMQPVVVPNWTDTNNWYMLAGPDQIESIEVGFLGGREEPEMFVQDQPQNGQVFTNDAITWKIRWFYGQAWLDYRGAYASIVT